MILVIFGASMLLGIAMWIIYDKTNAGECCSVCHNVGYDHFKYCPNCGAKMELEER